jgi:hypothetical protein
VPRPGLLRVGLLALDGTKVQADARRLANRTLSQIEAEVQAMLSEAARTDAEEDERLGSGSRGDELPEALGDRRSRLARLKACKARLEREERERQEAREQYLARRSAIEAERGRPLCGKKPRQLPSSSAAKANVSDPDSRVMRGPQGFLQGFNAQAVMSADRIVVAAAVTQEGNDRRQLRPMLRRAQENLKEAGAGRIGVVVADAGYWNERELAEVEGGPELLVATQETRGWSWGASSPPSPRRRRMERKLATERGRRLFARRQAIAEPVFGEIKGPRRAGRFMRRGLAACDSEWKLICTTNNLLKLWRALDHPG